MVKILVILDPEHTLEAHWLKKNKTEFLKTVESDKKKQLLTQIGAADFSLKAPCVRYFSSNSAV